MTDPHSYFHEATATLEPDVDALVAGGLERGRARRTRRTALAAVGAGVAVAVLTVGAVAAPQLLGTEPSGLAPAGDGDDRAVDPTPEPSERLKRVLEVPPSEVVEVFAEILGGGQVTADQSFPSADGGAIAHFQWNGFATSMIVDRFLDRGRTSLQECGALSVGMQCSQQVDGSVVSTWQERQPMVDGGVTGRGLSVYTVDGWTLTVISYNAAEPKESEVLATEPPLTFEQMEQVAGSGEWFTPR